MADFDAIVVGSGMSGGMSAKELTERGLKVLGIIQIGSKIAQLIIDLHNSRSPHTLLAFCQINKQ